MVPALGPTVQAGLASQPDKRIIVPVQHGSAERGSSLVRPECRGCASLLSGSPAHPTVRELELKQVHVPSSLQIGGRVAGLTDCDLKFHPVSESDCPLLSRTSPMKGEMRNNS